MRTVTKVRPPLSIDGALGRIAGLLPGAWKEMAEVVGKSETVVRRWGDHDAPDQIPLPCAIALDIAYQRAGGDDRPLFETYALQVQVARESAFAAEIDLARRVCALIKEGSEAHQAMIIASLPAATAAQRQQAIKELEDVAREVTSAIASLSGRATGPPEAPG